MLDWGKGRYEQTAAELEPIAEAIVAAAAPTAADRVLDVACATGNAALLAAARGADVVGVDASERRVAVAGRRAREAGLSAEFVVGDVIALPAPTRRLTPSCRSPASSSRPIRARAIREVARVLRPAGRADVTAWVPAGPIEAMLTVLGRAVGHATGAAPPRP